MKKGMHVQMKKGSKAKKNSIRINRNFFIFQGVLIGILLYLTWGSWVKFAIFVALELVVYIAFIQYLASKSNQKRKKKTTNSKNVYSKVRSGNYQTDGRSNYRELRRKNRKNYNWEISKSSSERKVKTSLDNNMEKIDKNSENSIKTSPLKEPNKSVTRMENKKFVPYRSPFDPITPKQEEEKEDTESVKEVLEADISMGEEIDLQDDEDIRVQEVEETEDENIDVMNTNLNINENEEEIIDGNIEDCIEEDFPKMQMEYNRNNEIFNLDFEDSNIVYNDDINDNVNINVNSHEDNYEDNYDDSYGDNYDDSYEDNYEDNYDENNDDNYNVIDDDTDISAIQIEELDDKIKESFSEPQEKIEVYHRKVQRENNNIELEEKKAIPSSVLNKQEVNDYKIVSAEKKLFQKEEYELPIKLLNKNEQLTYDEEMEEHIEYNSYKLIDTLASFGVGAKILNVSKGPTVTRYELQPNAGIKVSKILNLADDIALNLAATGVRIEAPIPGKAAVGIEIPNKKNVPVFLRDVVGTKEFQNHPSKLAFAIGKDIAGNVVVGDIAKMPHLLIAGATGSGKSVCINTLIVSILYKASPKDVRLLMVDPKVVELGIYNGIPHLLIPVVTEPKKAAGALSWAVIEMTNRYKLFAENNVRDLSSYNELIKERGEGETLPHIVIIIDELADLMMVAPNEVEDSICRLAQMARAAGMHLVIATQRPSVNVITGVIKANIPSRISFAVSSQIDSRTILDMAGAEKLLGRGDMLFYPLGQPKPIRVQGSFISDREVDKIVSHIKSLQDADYDEEILQKIDSQNEIAKPDTGGDDELLPQAIEMVLEMGQASASLIQRKFKVGYSRAARILDQMEAWGVVGASEGSKPRQLLITKQEWDELNT